MTNEEAAWFAGIVDGEGCITIKRENPTNRNSNPRYVLVLVVMMVHEAAIRRLCDLAGEGHVNSQLKKSATKGRWSDTYSWRVQSKAANKILERIRPYMVTKVDEANLAIEFYSKRSSVGHQMTLETRIEKDAMYVKMRELKKRNVFREDIRGYSYD